MNHFLFEDDLEVPDEGDSKVSSDSKQVGSPKTKSSKLWLDKGFLKEKDRAFFAESWRSSQNVWSPLIKNKSSFWDLMDKIQQASSKYRVRHKKLNSRKRIMSASGDFKLIPLLRKVSCEPDTSNASYGFNHNPVLRKNLNQPVRNACVVFNEDDSSISDNDDNLIAPVITVGDVSPAENP